MKRILTIGLCLGALLTAKAQFPVSDPHCAYCGVNLKTGEAHKKGCEYYSAPEEEETSKPSTSLKDYTPKQETKPTQPQKPVTQQQPTSSSSYKPVHEPWMDTPEYREYLNSEQIGSATDGIICEVPGKGQGIWTYSSYNKEGKKVGSHWLYSPRYMRIYDVDNWHKLHRAAMQLKTTQKWGVEDTEKVETVVDYEYDEVMTFNKGWGIIKLALNRKDANGHNHWIFYNGENLLSLSDHEIEELIPLRSSQGYGAGVLARQSNGEWIIFNTETGEVMATQLTDVKRMSIEDANRSTVMASVDINGKRQYGIFNGDGEQLFPFEYDNIMEKTGGSPYLVTYKNGKCGLIKRRTEYITNEYGNRTQVDKLTEFVEPRYDHFKGSNVLTKNLKAVRQYFMVDNNGQYGFLYADGKWDISTPTFYTPAEVEAYAQRVFDNVEDYSRGRIRTVSDVKGTGSYKDFCMDMTMACYMEADETMNPEEAKTTLSEENLKSRYLHLQDAHHTQYTLGKYDEARQAYPVQTHWGTVMLPVPPSEAKQVKKGWNSKKDDFYVKPWLDLDGNYETVINHISVLVNGKSYGFVQGADNPHYLSPKTPGCTECHGTGRCGICNGRGAVPTLSQPAFCRTCNGTGKCRACGGKGLML